MAYNLSLTTKNYIFSNIVPKLNFQQIQDGIGFTDSFFNYNKHHILIRVFKSTWINNPNQMNDEEKRILSAVQKKIEHSDTDEDDNILKEVQEKREIR